ncbi:hypothetical protein B296_00035891 [Ensete ventricosum]|uniref:Uncharacterized protein n=1 Tax=Ensete ventricosum TaxID=4639 RepID=A0A426XXU2_ENSVE|nr:hypothetical protein B296_00035891 [Ensete ventricosum]
MIQSSVGDTYLIVDVTVHGSLDRLVTLVVKAELGCIKKRQKKMHPTPATARDSVCAAHLMTCSCRWHCCLRLRSVLEPDVLKCRNEPSQ